jgi:hypothetical protein
MIVYKILTLIDRLQGKIATFRATRGLTIYNRFARDLPRMPLLDQGLDGCMKRYVEKNSAVGRTTNYLDACGGMGCAATEFTAMFEKRGGKAFVVDINEWKMNDFSKRVRDMARREGKKWGVEDNLSRQFTGIAEKVALSLRIVSRRKNFHSPSEEYLVFGLVLRYT